MANRKSYDLIYIFVDVFNRNTLTLSKACSRGHLTYSATSKILAPRRLLFKKSGFVHSDSVTIFNAFEGCKTI